MYDMRYPWAIAFPNMSLELLLYPYRWSVKSGELFCHLCEAGVGAKQKAGLQMQLHVTQEQTASRWDPIQFKWKQQNIKGAKGVLFPICTPLYNLIWGRTDAAVPYISSPRKMGPEGFPDPKTSFMLSGSHKTPSCQISWRSDHK